MAVTTNDVMEYVDQLRNYSTTNISSIQKGMVPEVLDIDWNKSDFYVSNGTRKYVYYETEGYCLRVNGIRFRTTLNDRKKFIYDKRMEDCVNEGLVYPFLLFVNGRHVKWSTFRIVRNTKYTYIVCDNDTIESLNPLHIDKVEIIHLPFTSVYYHEWRQVPKGMTEIFRFDEDGKLSNYGNIVYSIDTNMLNIIYRKYNALKGAKIENVDLDMDAKYKITENNFICFKNGLFDKTIDPYIKNLNLITFEDGTPLKYDLDYKLFYRDVTNYNRSNITIPTNKGLLKNLIVEEDPDIKDIDIVSMERDFDFKYKHNTEYEDNFKSGIRYISRYNTNFFDDLYAKESRINSIQMTGAEFKTKFNSNYKLSMPRGYHKWPETFVMIYKNGELWEFYNRIKYVNSDFEIPLVSTEFNKINDYDIFEIVYFSEVNNHFLSVEVDDKGNVPIPRTYLTYERRTAENTTIPYDNLIVLSNYTEDSIYPMIPFNKRTVFGVDYEINQKTKQITFKNENYYGKTIYMADKRQFKYAYFPISANTVRFFFDRTFIPCVDENRFMVFLNGRMLTKDMYRVIIPDEELSATEICVHIRKIAKKGDRVEIFYLPYDLNYVAMGKNNRVDVVTVRATNDRQPIFKIPYPVKSDTVTPDSFMVLRGSLLVDPVRYNVVGNTIVFIDPDDYLDYGRELTFIFLYNKNQDTNPYGFVKEEDTVILEPKYVYAQQDNQLEYTIPYPYANYDGYFFVTYRGLYVNPKRYTIDKQAGTIRFNDRSTGIDRSTAVIFVFVYPTEQYSVETTAVSVKATRDNQLIFNIPVPYSDYFKDGNTFFLIRNGVFLNDGEYVVDTKAKTVQLLTTEGLYIGQEIVFNFTVGSQLSVKVATEIVRAEQDGQMVFKLPEVFHDFNNKVSKFFAIVGDTFVDNRRYVIDGNDLRFLNSYDAFPEGRELTFLFIYCEPIDTETATIGTVTRTSKYTKFTTKTVPCKTNGQRTFDVPFPDALMYNKNIIVTIGSTFVYEDQYKLNKGHNSITFTSDGIETTADRGVTFTLVDSNYVVVSKDIEQVTAVVDGQTEFDIPIPFENYFKQGNSVLVFANQTFIEPTRYRIDADNNTLSLLSTEDALKKGQIMTYMFFYIANPSNRSYTREDVQHNLVTDYGYVYLDRQDLNHPMHNKLYFMYVNGKKIDKDNIMNISNNIIRLRSDIQTRFNMVLLDYTPQIEALAPYTKINSDYDILLNKASSDSINSLFEVYSKMTDIEYHIVPDTSQEAIVNDIIRTHYLGNGVNRGIPFLYTGDVKTLKNRNVYELAQTTERFVESGRYSFVVPAGVTMLEVRSIGSASRVKPISEATKTLGYYVDSDIVLGEPSFILPSEQADSMLDQLGRSNFSFTCTTLDLTHKTKADTLSNPFIPGIVPKRNTDTAATYGGPFSPTYTKLRIRNVKVYPGVTYRITVPENAWVHIAYDKWNTDYNNYHLKYRINFNSARHNMFYAFTGDTTATASNYTEDYNFLYGDSFSLTYNQSYTKKGTYYFTAPAKCNEIILAMTSGFEANKDGFAIPKMTTFQVVGFEKNRFSVAPVPELSNPTTYQAFNFYDPVNEEYVSTFLDEDIPGVKLFRGDDGRTFGSTISEVGFIPNSDRFRIEVGNSMSEYTSEEIQRFYYLLENGVEVSVSTGNVPKEEVMYMKVKPLQRLTIYVAEGELSNLGGGLSITYDTQYDVTEVRDSKTYMAEVMDASRDKIANPVIDYTNINKEKYNKDMANEVDAGSVSKVTNEDTLLDKDKPVFNKEIPKPDFAEEEGVGSLNRVIIHNDGQYVSPN